MNYPRAKCPKCDNTTFAARAIEPKDSRFAMVAVCCDSCGAVVGVQPIANTENLIRELAKNLGFTLQ